MDNVIVDLKNRDDDFILSAVELKQAIQSQKLLERDVSGRYTEVLSSFGVVRPVSLCCVPGLRL